jgi:hypothetical protein
LPSHQRRLFFAVGASAISRRHPARQDSIRPKRAHRNQE